MSATSFCVFLRVWASVWKKGRPPFIYYKWFGELCSSARRRLYPPYIKAVALILLGFISLI